MSNRGWNRCIMCGRFCDPNKAKIEFGHTSIMDYEPNEDIEVTCEKCCKIEALRNELKSTPTKNFLYDIVDGIRNIFT